jgi:hypothetical protein
MCKSKYFNLGSFDTRTHEYTTTTQRACSLDNCVRAPTALKTPKTRPLLRVTLPSAPTCLSIMPFILNMDLCCPHIVLEILNSHTARIMCMIVTRITWAIHPLRRDKYTWWQCVCPERSPWIAFPPLLWPINISEAESNTCIYNHSQRHHKVFIPHSEDGRCHVCG